MTFQELSFFSCPSEKEESLSNDILSNSGMATLYDATQRNVYDASTFYCNVVFSGSVILNPDSLNEASFNYALTFGDSKDYSMTAFSCISIPNIIYDNKKLHLTTPIMASINFQSNMFTIENKELDIIAMSTDYNKCLEDFYDEVFFVWEEYGKANDDILTDDAKELKRKILQYVRS